MQRSALCRSRRELSNAYLLANFGFDTAENEPCKDCATASSTPPRCYKEYRSAYGCSFQWSVHLRERPAGREGLRGRRRHLPDWPAATVHCVNLSNLDMMFFRYILKLRDMILKLSRCVIQWGPVGNRRGSVSRAARSGPGAWRPRR